MFLFASHCQQVSLAARQDSATSVRYAPVTAERDIVLLTFTLGEASMVRPMLSLIEAFAS